MSNKIKTCVIGSYPVNIDAMELMKGYFNGREISWDKYIEFAVNDMVNAGLDIVSDGQTRDSFIQIFTRKLKGCRIRARTEIIDKVEYNGPITVKDQNYVRGLIPSNTELIGVLTGPYALSKSCVDLYYNNEKDLAFDFAYALNKEAKALQKHVDMISIDEPFFSNEMPEYGKELIEITMQDVSCPTRLHVCGDVSDMVPELLEIPVNILSHEFKASPQLFDAFSEYDIPQNICLGAVRSDDIRIESVKEIMEHIEKAIGLFGERIVQMSPDCGQRLLSRNVAFKKLKNLVAAGENING
ncbi:methionine synthase II (cobalamin-independent) [Thermoplasmatales archaeon SCGC AB-539-N05]|nr:methionine synthase II (cobalamin-independent) [Thermoplasmatales archaeon SCGC AB-539-N05]